MEPIWGRQDPGGPHVSPMNLAIRVTVFPLRILAANRSTHAGHWAPWAFYRNLSYLSNRACRRSPKSCGCCPSHTDRKPNSWHMRNVLRRHDGCGDVLVPSWRHSIRSHQTHLAMKIDWWSCASQLLYLITTIIKLWKRWSATWDYWNSHHISWFTQFTDPRMHQFHIPQWSNQKRNVHISVLNGAFWDMGQVQCGICEIGILRDTELLTRRYVRNNE